MATMREKWRPGDRVRVTEFDSHVNGALLGTVREDCGNINTSRDKACVTVKLDKHRKCRRYKPSDLADAESVVDRIARLAQERQL